MKLCLTSQTAWRSEHTKLTSFMWRLDLMEDIDVLWVVPSSNSNDDLKTLVASRHDQWWETTSTSFDEYIKIHSSCYIKEQKGKEFYRVQINAGGMCSQLFTFYPDCQFRQLVTLQWITSENIKSYQTLQMALPFSPPFPSAAKITMWLHLSAVSLPWYFAVSVS